MITTLKETFKVTFNFTFTFTFNSTMMSPTMIYLAFMSLAFFAGLCEELLPVLLAAIVRTFLVVRSSTMLIQATAAVSIGLIFPNIDLVCFFLAILAVGVLQFHVGKFVLVVSKLVSNISLFVVIQVSIMMLGNPVLHGVECPPALEDDSSPPTRPSVSWNTSGNVGYEYDKHAPASTRGTEFRNVPFVKPRPTRPIPRQVLVVPKECPSAPARSRSRKGPGPLPCPIQLDPTFLQYAHKKRPLEFSNICEVVERPKKRVKFDGVVVVENVADEEDESSFCFSLASDSDDEDSLCSSLYSTDNWTHQHHGDGDPAAVTVGVDDEDDDKSTHCDGDPVTVPVVVETPPLRRSARIAAKKSADNYNSFGVVLERPLPRSARIAATGIRRSSRLAAKARVNYRL
jgi:hypothetical protein